MEIKIKYICKRENGHIFSEIFTLEKIEKGEVSQWYLVNNIGGRDVVYKCLYTSLKDNAHLDRMSAWEVVGNIYENPELARKDQRNETL